MTAKRLRVLIWCQDEKLALFLKDQLEPKLVGVEIIKKKPQPDEWEGLVLPKYGPAEVVIYELSTVTSKQAKGLAERICNWHNRPTVLVMLADHEKCCDELSCVLYVDGVDSVLYKPIDGKSVEMIIRVIRRKIPGLEEA